MAATPVGRRCFYSDGVESVTLSGCEQAIFGPVSVDDAGGLINRYLRQHLGGSMSEVLFRSGRIDAVWAVRTNDGREVVIKAHRQPVDLAARQAAMTAQRLLAAAQFPCPEPVSGPDEFERLVLSAESLLPHGTLGNGRDPGTRRSIAAGLSEHIDILRGRSDLTALAGAGPAWCQYQRGHWPVPHDPIFNFATSPVGFDWLPDFAQEAADRLVHAEGRDAVVVGHADWYCGNLRFDSDARLVAAFDWDLVAGTEAAIAGMTAGCYTASGTAGTDLPTPEDVAAFLLDYDSVRPRPFSGLQQTGAAAAASWTIAYNARCELSMLTGPPAPGSTLEMAHRNQDEYLQLRW